MQKSIDKISGQGKVESHFGTQGLASKTNSVWNYKAFDGYKLNEIPKDEKYKLQKT